MGLLWDLLVPRQWQKADAVGRTIFQPPTPRPRPTLDTFPQITEAALRKVL